MYVRNNMMRFKISYNKQLAEYVTLGIYDLKNLRARSYNKVVATCFKEKNTYYR